MYRQSPDYIITVKCSQHISLDLFTTHHKSAAFNTVTLVPYPPAIGNHPCTVFSTGRTFLDSIQSDMDCKNLSPFCRLSFYFVNCFLCGAKSFEFDIVPSVNFLLLLFGLWCHAKRIIAKTIIDGLSPYIFF